MSMAINEIWLSHWRDGHFNFIQKRLLNFNHLNLRLVYLWGGLADFIKILNQHKWDTTFWPYSCQFLTVNYSKSAVLLYCPKGTKVFKIAKNLDFCWFSTINYSKLWFMTSNMYFGGMFCLLTIFVLV